MRLLRLAFWILFIGLGLYVFAWFRERYSRGGPMPARQAALLHHPVRRFVHPLPQTLEKFHIKPGDTVLELGPGSGYFTVEAARMVGPGGRIVCVDVQPEMIALLRGRLDEGSGVKNVHPAVGDATNLPLSDDSVDAAFLVTVLGEIPDRPRALSELRRVLKPGGLLAFSEHLTDPDYVLQRELRDLCRAIGFEEVETTSERLGYTMVFRAA